MAFSHIHSTSIFVNDQDKAVDFYVNKLGFEKRQDEPMGYEEKPDVRWIEVVPPGAQTRIVLIKGFSDWSEDKVGNDSGLVLTSNDTYGTCEEIKARGVEFIEEPNEQPWGIQAQIKDQDGNTIVIVGS